jgi:hypothetical protein
MKQEKSLSVGDRVEITKEGVIAHQKHHDDHVNIMLNVSTPFTNNTKLSIPLMKNVTEIGKQTIFTFPKPGFQGEIVEVKQRWWGQSGYDYLVRWHDCSGQSWHLSEHLLPIT